MDKQIDIDLLIERITDEIYRKLSGSTSLNGSCCKSSAPAVVDYAGMVDHTLLKAVATADDVRTLCAEAAANNFASVCVNPSYVPLCYELLKGTSVKVCTVVGFPLGATTTKTKVFETKEAMENGATEIDMVIHVGAAKAGDWDLVKNDIEAVYLATQGRALLKVIIETCLLTDEEKVRVCAICKQIGVGFVKTSTGFSTGGATVEDVRLMRKVVGSEIGVKASGGVKSAADAKAMVEAGANRLGTSSGLAIATGCPGRGKCGSY